MYIARMVYISESYNVKTYLSVQTLSYLTVNTPRIYGYFLQNVFA